MPFTVLTNDEVCDLLHSLDRNDVINLQQNLAEALHSYSTGNTNSPCCAVYQPMRTAIKKNGTTTLFMPASTGDSVGIKIMSLEQPEHEIPEHSPPSRSQQSSVSSAQSSLRALELTPTDSTSASSISGNSFEPTPSTNSTQSTNPRGTVTLLDVDGYPMGILNARDLTAFRSALAATMLLNRRRDVHTITVFGAGKQAYWHLRIALMLRGEDVHHVNIINRSFDRAIKLMKAVRVADGADPHWKTIKFSAVSPEFGDYGRLLKEEIRKADVIFCCTPSLEPLFPHEFLTSTEGRKKGRYISAIGSYAPNMIELHPEILRVAVKPTSGGHHLHKHAKSEGVVVVDSLEACLKEAGEIVQAKLKPDQLVEVGELIMVKKAAMREVEAGGDGEKGLIDWLRKGNVIYKSVGLGLMDLVCGADLVKLARERNVGTTIQDL